MSGNLIRSILKNNRFLKGLEVKPVRSGDSPEIALVKRILSAHGTPVQREEQRVEAAEEYIEKVQPEESDEKKDTPASEPAAVEPKVVEVEKVVEVTDNRPHPSYRFDIERDDDGRISSVIATPIDGVKRKPRSLSEAVSAAMEE